MKNTGKVALGISLLAAAFVLVSGAGSVKAKSEIRINEGVYIGSINVGGMTEAEATDAVNAYVDKLLSTTFELKGVVGSVEATAEDMGVSTDVETAVAKAIKVGNTGNLIRRFKEVTDLKKDNIIVPMELSIDREATATLMYERASKLNQEAVDAVLTRENGEFVITPGQIGQEVDYVQSVYKIDNYLSNEWDEVTTEIDLVVETVQPRGTVEELSKVKDVLGKFSTDFSSSAPGRAKNVKNGCSKINGSVVYPGDEFSVYKAVSPFTAENGYELAGSYANGATVETFGGGICQVSTTLYNAVIRSELEVSLRFNHSMIVGYVDPSADAAISGEYKDFRFINNTDAPIYIEGVTGGGIISFTVYGQETRPSNRKVSFVSETLSSEEGGIKFVTDSNFDVGYWHTEQSAHKGVVAKLWKIVSVDGVQQSKEVFNNSKYKKSPKIVTVGTKGCPEENIGALKAACGGEDEAAVKAAIAAAKETIERNNRPDPEPQPGPETQPENNDGGETAEGGSEG